MFSRSRKPKDATVGLPLEPEAKAERLTDEFAKIAHPLPTCPYRAPFVVPKIAGTEAAG